MNLKNFVLGLFRGLSLNGELDQVREAGKKDAQLVVNTYLAEFEAEAARLMTLRQRKLIGLDDPDVIDVKVSKTRRKLVRSK